jgi:hypothetical protein
VELVHGHFVLCPERNIRNASLCRTPPPIMPYAVVKIGSFHLSKLVIEQKECLHASFNESKMREIEIQYLEFETCFYRDKGFEQIVDNTEDTKSFHEAWGLFYKDYLSLVSFFWRLGDTISWDEHRGIGFFYHWVGEGCVSFFTCKHIS